MSKVQPRMPNAALDQILSGPRGLIRKMNGIRPAASIAVKCGPADIHLTACGPLGKNFGRPWSKVFIRKHKIFGRMIPDIHRQFETSCHDN